MGKIIRQLAFQRSALALIIVNLIPLIGVLYFDWQLFILVLLYWLENVVIGLINVLKMLSAYQTPILEKIFKTCFFSVHYGFFCFCHGTILVSIFGDEEEKNLPLIQIITDYGLYLALAALFASHAFSFLQNFIVNGERKRLTLSELMVAPYKRIIVLHMFILFGGLIIDEFGESLLGLLVLAALKTMIDLITHQKEHKNLVQKIHFATDSGN